MSKGYTQAQNKATQKYIKEHYNTMTIRCAKEKIEEYKAYAKSKGSSFTGLVCELLESAMKKDKFKYKPTQDKEE